jgi:hypothetical protein
VQLSLLTPLAALVGLGAGLALAALVLAERRSRRLCALLGLPAAGARSAVAPALALVLLGTLVGLAAAQPVVSTQRSVQGRTDAEAIMVFDITRSMLARDRVSLPSRFDRARSVAKELRAAIPDVPVGVASLSDRVLPHLFPTTSANVFTAALDRSLGIERPPPDQLGRGRVTALGALQALATNNFYGVDAKRRVAVVLTDGESLPVDQGTLRARLFSARIVPIFVHVWGSEERVFGRDGLPDRLYRPDPQSRESLDGLAEYVGGRSFGENEVGRAVDALREAVGRGPTGPQGKELQAVELSGYTLAFAFVPLLYLLWRRNVRAA